MIIGHTYIVVAFRLFCIHRITDCMHKIIERTFYRVWGQCEFPVSSSKEKGEYKIFSARAKGFCYCTVVH